MAKPVPISQRFFQSAVSLFWGTYTTGQILWTMVRKGPVQFFHVKKRDFRPACLEEPRLGTHSFAQLKDVKLHYVVNGPEDKPLMLFLHGFPECWYSWRHQMPHFSKDYRVVAVDMRGYGESDKPAGVDQYTMDKLTGDVAQLIEKLGYKECVLVAHDWGGAVANGFTLLYPQMVSRLVLMNIPHPKAFQEHLQSSWTQFRMSWYMFMFQWPWLPELFVKSHDYAWLDLLFKSKIKGARKAPCDADEAEAYKYSLSRPGGLTGPINYYRAAFRYLPPRYPGREIKVPTLMIWGELDRALDKVMAENSRKYIPDFTLKYIPDATHWVSMDAPDDVNKYMTEFLNAKQSPASKL